MSKLPSARDGSTNNGATPTQSGTFAILATIMDTTWRMFVPTLLGLGLGFWVDRQLPTMPWGMLIGLLLGVLPTIWLVRAQFKKVARS